jgi:Histidine phosphatase superfamily (branch 1)
MSTVYTIGYESTDIERIIATLKVVFRWSRTQHITRGAAISAAVILFLWHSAIPHQATGEFFARPPLGESRCNVADRVKGVFATILRDASNNRVNPITDFIVVSHGVTIRLILRP